MHNFLSLLSMVKPNNITLLFMAVIFVVFVISILLKEVFSRFIISLFYKLFSKSKLTVDIAELKPATKSLHIIFVFTLTYGAAFIFSNIFSDDKINYIALLLVSKRIYRMAMIVAVSILIYSLVPFFLRVQRKVSKKDEITDNPIIGIFIERVLKIIVVVICIIAILSELGINVNGLITGVGLGGLTFALAAQDTAANLFGGVVLISDKPFLVGDWISTDELEGVVEDISFRSTRIRTFDDALVVVPNSKLSSVAITNWAKMTKRRVNFKVGLSYDTEKEQLQNILEALRQSLIDRDVILPDSVIVRLDELSLVSINIRVIFYADVTNLSSLKNVVENVNFEILSIVKDNGASFAQVNLASLSQP